MLHPDFPTARFAGGREPAGPPGRPPALAHDPLRARKGFVVRVYVGNLPFSCTNDKLRDLFAKHGQVDSAQVVTDRETGRSRGFGFVEMADEDARKAIEALNQQDFDGRTLVVNEAKPREERGGRGGRGGRGNF